MRDCPGCKGGNAFRVVREYNAVSVEKSGGEAPKMALWQCEDCNMLYVDRQFPSRDVSQSWFDHYYLTYYKTDDAPFSDARLESLAACIHETFLSENTPHVFRTVFDIGGTDGELQERLKKWGIIAYPSGVDDGLTSGYSSVVLSHTLEHIYDVPAMFERIKAALIPAGLLFVEVPIWLTYDDLTYDNHWQHINKFRPSDLENIFKANGFDVILSTRIEDYREYKVWRIIGRMA